MAVRENQGIRRYEPPIEHLVGDEALDQTCAWRLLDESLQLLDIGDIGSVLDPQRTHDVEPRAPLVEAAKRAADGWRLYPAPKRGEILYRAAEIMLRRKDDLAREMTLEMGKVLAESRGDVQEGIDMTYYIAGEGRRQFGDVVPAELPNKWAMSMRHPHGVVAAITPWNFPFAIPTWKIMPALVLGNTVVFKPASFTPMMAVRLVEILEEAGLPKGVLNLVLGSGGDLGDHIVKHPLVDLISFTGSSDNGAQISEIAGRLLKRVSCELGGRTRSSFSTTPTSTLSLGGSCGPRSGRPDSGAPGLACIAHRVVANDLIDNLSVGAKKMKMGTVSNRQRTSSGRCRRPRGQGRELHADREKEGARSPRWTRPDEGALGKVLPRADCAGRREADTCACAGEIFGPVTSVIEVSNIDEAIKG